MPPRYTIRQVVGTYRRKAFGTRNDDGTPRRPPYPPDAIVAFYGTLELAEEQPIRGRFESERLLRVLLEGPVGHGRRYARAVAFLVAQGDLVRCDDGALAVEGWEVLQEGDSTIADRVARFRSRKRASGNDTSNAGGNDHVTPLVTPPVTQDPRTGVARPQRRGDGDGFGDGFGEGGARTGGDVTQVIDYVEERTRRPWQFSAGSKPFLALESDVRDFGADAVIEAMRSVSEAHPDVGQLVFGATRRLHPISNGTAEEPDAAYVAEQIAKQREARKTAKGAAS